MRKITFPRLLLLNLLFALVGLLAWRIPLSSLLSTYYFNEALANILVNGDGHQDTTDYLVRSATLDPDNYIAHYWLGTVYYQDKDYVNAARAFESFIALSPLNSNAYYFLGESHFELGQFDLAAQAHLEAIRLDPMNTDFLTTIMERYQSVGRDYEYFVSLYRLASLTADTGERLKFTSELAKVFERSPELIQINTGSPLGFGRQTSAVLNEDGKLYILAHSDKYPNLIVVSSSDNAGDTWTVIKVLYVMYGGIDPDGTMAIDQRGTVHLFYGDKGAQSIYTNSKSNFDVQVPMSEAGDSRQLGVDVDGVVHLVWFKGSTIFHTQLPPNGSWGNVEPVATGIFPSLAIDGNKLIVAYNLDENFPSRSGGVLVSEKTNGAWSKGLRISKEGVWAGASTVVASDGDLHVIYIEEARPQPVLVYARRDAQKQWSFAPVDETYLPYIPQNLSFGGRTAPGIQVIDGKVYFLWRSGATSSPILLKILDLKTGKSENPQILDALGDANFSAAPSFLGTQSQTEPGWVLWTKNGQPFISSR